MYPSGNVKHSKQGKPNPPITFCAFPQDKALCPITAIDSYIGMTKSWRGKLSEEDQDHFWLSVNPPHKPISKSSLTRWITSLLNKAGIDTETFKSHSLRAASSSKVSQQGISTKDILERGNWKGTSVWEKHYHKEICKPSEMYTRTLLTLANKT